MATKTDKYLIEVEGRLIGADVFEKMNRRIRQLEKEARTAAAGVNQTTKAVTRLGKASGNAASGMGKFQSLGQNLSYQFTDFAVQVEGGVTKMRAFSQQAPQVAGALGAAGIGGAAGIAVFAIASLAAALAPTITRLLTTETAAEKAAKQLKVLSDIKIDFGGTFSGIKSSQKDLEVLTETGKKMNEFLVQLEKVKLNEQIKSEATLLADAFKRLSKEAAAVPGAPILFRGGIDLGVRAKSTFKELGDELGFTIDQIRQLESLQKGLFDLKNAEEFSQRLLDIASYLKQLIPFAADGGLAISKLIKQLTDLQAKVAEEGGLLDDTSLRAAAKGWQELAKALPDEEVSLAQQIENVEKWGKALEKPKEEINQLKTALIELDEQDRTAEREKQEKTFFEEVEALSEDFYARLEKRQKEEQARIEETRRIIKSSTEEYMQLLRTDTTTKAAGFQQGLDVIDELNAKTEQYKEGLRVVLKTTQEGSEEWKAIKKLMGESLTPLERIKEVIREIKEDQNAEDSLKAVWDKFKKTLEETPELIAKIEAALFGVEETGKHLFEEIADAVDRQLLTSIEGMVEATIELRGSWSDMISSMIGDIGRLIIKMAIMKSIEQSLGNTSFGSWLFSGSQTTGGTSSGQSVSASGVTSIPRLASTGVGPLISNNSTGKDFAPTTVNVVNNSGSEAMVSESSSPGGGRQIEVFIEKAVDRGIAKGRFDKSLSGIYGLRRRGS